MPNDGRSISRNVASLNILAACSWSDKLFIIYDYLDQNDSDRLINILRILKTSEMFMASMFLSTFSIAASKFCRDSLAEFIRKIYLSIFSTLASWINKSNFHSLNVQYKSILFLVKKGKQAWEIFADTRISAFFISTLYEFFCLY